MRLYDTRRDRVVPFVGARTVRLYVCGVTPYDATHLGHAFTYTAFDALVRLLEHRGHRVRYVRNVTDVDDDILRTAREAGRSHEVIAREEVERFLSDCAALNLRPPDVEPWASEAVPAIQRAIAGLLEQGVAYDVGDGRVYYDVRAAGDALGALSKLDRETMLVEFGEKGGDPDAPDKRDPLDFLLWQPSAPDEPAWGSPWGAGRPGWHIECSAMAMEELGGVIDVHGGGRDLVFPHHEAEILQSEGLTGQGPFARWWLHTGMAGLDGHKMSKSERNLVFVADLRERYAPAAIKRYLLQHHYREDWSFDADQLDAACQSVKAWADVAGDAGRDEAAEARMVDALENDLDTPTALAVLDELAGAGRGESVRWGAGLLGIDLGAA
ncbi:cysteine--tRNA ligase [Egibacter rhizosphaerae]|uniref:Cysteine--tRNA ligase n=1 Tax=Egibacter rhizosphaerae TaxID=1670831 RepID=A0A411YCH8_9ACTN|nr:cysteine--tRNA ligase [Egibacter rhizosphaerae]QBI18909.1 cysteine--tRNA ligase [Egibacter rhizosphaerae]